MGHGMGAHFKALGNQHSEVVVLKRRSAIRTEDGNIERCGQACTAQHVCDPQVLRISVVPTGSYDCSVYHGKVRRCSLCVARRERLVRQSTAVARSADSLRSVPSATPTRKKNGTAEWENSKYGCTKLSSNPSTAKANNHKWIGHETPAIVLAS